MYLAFTFNATAFGDRAYYKMNTKRVPETTSGGLHYVRRTRS
jgi:hypothetical protein